LLSQSQKVGVSRQGEKKEKKVTAGLDQV